MNSNREFLPVSDIKGNQVDRWLHLATLKDSFRTFMCFADVLEQKVYIEEIIGGHLETIDDDIMMEELHNTLLEAGILSMSKPLFADQDWLRRISERKC